MAPFGVVKGIVLCLNRRLLLLFLEVPMAILESYSTRDAFEVPADGLEFEVIEQPGGGYVAACYAENIFLEARTLRILYQDIKIAIADKFEGRAMPSEKDIRLVLHKG